MKAPKVLHIIKKFGKLIGLLLLISAIPLGLYLGVWVFFIGGIIDIIQEIKAEQLNSFNIAIGIVRIVFSGFVGWAVGVIIFVIGGAIRVACSD